MIKTTLGHLLQAVGYFNAADRPFGRLAALPLPAGQSFKVVKLARAIDAQVQAFREVHAKLPEEVIPADDPQFNPAKEGEQKRLTKEGVEQLNELLAQPVTLQEEKLRIEQMAHVSITGLDMFALSFLFDGLDEEAPAATKGNGKGAPNPKPKNNKHKLVPVPPIA